MEKEKRKVSFTEALILLAVYVGIMSWGGIVGKVSTAMCVLICGIVTAAYGMLVLHFEWDEIQGNILKLLGISLPAMLILLNVGLMTASWLASGTTPFLIYWGLKLISPSVFLIAAFLITTIASGAIGSAWATVGTCGVALYGIAMGLGVSPGIAAGAIVSGSFMGDKWSPLADCPNLQAAIAGSSVIKLVTIMVPTSGLAALGAAVVFGIMGFVSYSNGVVDASILNPILAGIEGKYNLNPLLLLPLVVVVFLTVKKKPILPVLIIGVLLGALFAVVLQDITIGNVLNILYKGNRAATGVPMLDKILSGGGLSEMMSLVLIIFCAFVFAGAVETIGFLEAILTKTTSIIKSTGSLVVTTAISSILTIYLTGSVYVSQILNGRMFILSYDKAGLEKTVLARTVEETAVITGAYVPWSGGCLIILGTLGVPWYEYMPYILSHWFAVALVILYGFTGLFTEKIPVNDKDATESTTATPTLG